VSFHELLQNVIDDTLGTAAVPGSLWAFRPELALCATIVALLLVRMLVPRWRNAAFYVAAAGLLESLYLLYSTGIPDQSTPIFTGMLIFDSFSFYMRGLLLFFALLLASFTQTSGIPDEEDSTEFYVLALGATLGMCLMVAANHMAVVFLGIEMASVPSYALAGLLRGRRQSSEAALKFAVFGAGTAGVMLYGISLLVGALGSAHIPTMAVRLAEMMPGMIHAGLGADRTLILVLGSIMLMVGLAFKLSAVPFHFWTPDVFEGATAEVAAFLSIASKTAALGLLVRVAIGFGAIAPSVELVHAPDAASGPAMAVRVAPDAAADARPGEASLGEALRTVENQGELQRRAELVAALEPVRQYLTGLIALLAAVTCTFGNLAAYGQTNMKRLLAYSTIAHAGYMMMPVAAAVALAGRDPRGAADAVASLAFYAAVYLFMNLGAFAAVAFLRNTIGSEEIADYAGLIRRSPGLTVCIAFILFSLVGMPPLAGFMAKFTIFAAVYDAGLLALLVVGVLNTVLSLFYYLRVVRVMAVTGQSPGPAAEVPMSSTAGAYCLIVTAPIVILGLWWDGLFLLARTAAGQLFPL
jgi:NADH-quinone oxidoreductase subunit N